jgi:hypothetical protein
LKEPRWRLAADAIPGARFRAWTCPCGAASAASRGRCHSFWDCAVAQAVLAQLADPGLPGGPVPAVLREHVWLVAAPPGYTAPADQWRRVALAVVAAMEHGRRVLWARTVGGDAAAPATVAAGNLAVERFWALVRDASPP